jgi:hypothetical protein
MKIASKISQQNIGEIDFAKETNLESSSGSKTPNKASLKSEDTFEDYKKKGELSFATESETKLRSEDLESLNQTRAALDKAGKELLPSAVEQAISNIIGDAPNIDGEHPTYGSDEFVARARNSRNRVQPINPDDLSAAIEAAKAKKEEEENEHSKTTKSRFQP